MKAGKKTDDAPSIRLLFIYTISLQWMTQISSLWLKVFQLAFGVLAVVDISIMPSVLNLVLLSRLCNNLHPWWAYSDPTVRPPYFHPSLNTPPSVRPRRAYSPWLLHPIKRERELQPSPPMLTRWTNGGMSRAFLLFNANKLWVRHEQRRPVYALKLSDHCLLGKRQGGRADWHRCL